MIAALLILGAVLAVGGFTWVTEPAGRAALALGVVCLLAAVDLRPTPPGDR